MMGLPWRLPDGMPAVMNVLLLIPFFLWGDPVVTVLEAEPRQIDCGVIRAGVPLKKQFTLRNTAPTGQIRITTIRSSCGCLQALPRVTTLQPGRSICLPVHVRTTATAPGPKRWRLEVSYQHQQTANELRSDVLTLELVGEVHRRLEVQPAALVIPARPIREYPIQIRHHQRTPLRILQIKTSSPHLQVRQRSGSRDEPAQLWVQPGEKIPETEANDTILVQLDDPEQPWLEIPVTVRSGASQRIEALPAEIELDSRGGRSASCLVRLRDREGEPVSIRRVQVEGLPQVSVRYAKGTYPVTTLRVTVHSEEFSAPENGALEVEFATPVGERIRIPMKRWR